MIMTWSKQLSEVILYALESCDPFFNNMHVCVLQFSRVSLFLRTLLLVQFVTIRACSQGCSKYATTSHAYRKIMHMLEYLISAFSIFSSQTKFHFYPFSFQTFSSTSSFEEKHSFMWSISSFLVWEYSTYPFSASIYRLR